MTGSKSNRHSLPREVVSVRNQGNALTIFLIVIVILSFLLAGRAVYLMLEKKKPQEQAQVEVPQSAVVSPVENKDKLLQGIWDCTSDRDDQTSGGTKITFGPDGSSLEWINAVGNPIESHRFGTYALKVNKLIDITINQIPELSKVGHSPAVSINETAEIKSIDSTSMQFAQWENTVPSDKIVFTCLRKESGKVLADRNEALTRGIVMVKIPGKNYELGQYEVTQKEWQAVMGNNPSVFKECGENCPVERVSWDDIQVFLYKLNQMTGKRYRLPTMEEWEFACYGGQKTKYCGSNNINEVTWYKGNSNQTTHPVGQKKANGYGLYDMSGNVWEWTGYESDTVQYANWYPNLGGSWYNTPQDVRASSRWDDYRPTLSSNLGFRLARTLP